MTTNQLVLDLNLTEDAEFIQVYDKGQFCTVIENDLLYLLKSTCISKYNVIATFAINGDCTIYNRDFANCFVDRSHKYFGQSNDIDELPEDKIKSLMKTYLNPDIINLMKFKETEFSGNFKRLFNTYSKESQEKILEGLEKLGVYKNNKFIIPWTQLTTTKQIEWSNSKLFSFVKLNLENMHYDICSRTLNGGYIIAAKNGNCCTDKKFEKDLVNKCYIIFNTSCISTVYDKNIVGQIKEDLKSSSYLAANKFIKIEEKLIKDLDILIEDAISKQFFINMSEVEYPNIDTLAEKIVKYIKQYQKSNDLVEKSELICALKEVYSEAYNNLQKSQISYERLYNKINERQ